MIDSRARNGKARSFAADQQTPPRGMRGWLARIGDGRILLALLVLVFVTHALNMFKYPLFLGDEGIYLEQAWSVIREGRLSPYTYFYDHAPGGWLLLAWWFMILPGKFHTFGMSVNAGRVLMLTLNLGSAVLLYRVTKKLSGSDVAAIFAVLVFAVSPLSVYYQRMILLDNIMVFWLLLSLHLILSDGNRILTLVASGTAFGIALLTKENAFFFAPVLLWMLYSGVRNSYRSRFAVAGWAATMVMIVSIYPLYALLKGELFPTALDSMITSKPAEHVSLISTFFWQMGRPGGSIVDPYSDFWRFFWTKWWQKDPLILLFGAGATVVNLAIGIWGRRRGQLAAALLSVAFAFYLTRGSVILEFYVVPLLPFLAMNVGMLVDEVLGRLPATAGFAGAVIGLVALLGTFIPGAYDHYTLDLTQLQVQQLAYIRQNIPPTATLLIDDDLWVDMHEPSTGQAVYANAHSHWKIASDPDIRDRLLHGDYRNIDYLIMSNKLDEEFQRQYTDQQLPVQALQHSVLIWQVQKGDVRLEIRQVVK